MYIRRAKQRDWLIERNQLLIQSWDI